MSLLALLAKGPTVTPEPAPPIEYVVRRQVTADCWRTGRVTTNRTGGKTYASPHRVRAHGRDLRLTYGGNLPAGVTMPMSVTVLHNSTRHRVTVGGATTWTLTGETPVASDSIPGLTVAPGDELLVLTYYGPRSDGGSHPAAPGGWYDREILDGDQTETGTPRTDTALRYDGYNGYRPVMPHAITAMTEAGQYAVALLGDSITESGAPALDRFTTAASAQRTWAHRVVDLTHPVANTAIWGSTYATARTGAWATVPDLAAFTHAVVAWGYNDLNQAHQTGKTVDTVKATALASWKWAHGEGPLLWQATISPNTTSTDGWTTVEGQTPVAATPMRLAYNDWLRDGAPLTVDASAPAAAGSTGTLRAGQEGHPLAGIIDQAEKISTAPNSGIFRVDQGPLTTDGGHPNSRGHELMAEAAQAWLQGITP
ncbi:hypothetical protein M3C66_007730 [Micrococcus luteus]|nr:hypothetical protein [Micrococcus luteus]